MGKCSIYFLHSELFPKHSKSKQAKQKVEDFVIPPSVKEAALQGVEKSHFMTIIISFPVNVVHGVGVPALDQLIVQSKQVSFSCIHSTTLLQL